MTEAPPDGVNVHTPMDRITGALAALDKVGALLLEISNHTDGAGDALILAALRETEAAEASLRKELDA